MIKIDLNQNILWQKIRSICRDRIVITLCLTAVLSFVLDFRRTKDVTGMVPEDFWSMKIDWKENADMVLTGDSRAYRGLSPEVIKQHLPGMKILNYGFSGAGFADYYLRAAENVLDPGSDRKIIVLGITPHSLTTGAVEDNGFVSNSSKSFLERKMYQTFAPLMQFFRPVRDAEFMNMIGIGRHGVRYFLDYRPSGWVASHKVPENPNEAFKTYSTVFDPGKSGPVSDQIIDQLMHTVARWRQQGIEVYALRPPSCSRMVELEKNLSGFDEKAFVAKLRKAGGVWLDFDQDGYHTYDGSHLIPEAARKLSSELAQKIQAFHSSQPKSRD